MEQEPTNEDNEFDLIDEEFPDSAYQSRFIVHTGATTKPGESLIESFHDFKSPSQVVIDG